MTQKILVFTDLHYVAEGKGIGHLDPDARFREGLAHAQAQFPDAERLVIAGDLAHHGSHAEYARLRDALDECPMPVHLMIGNHDARGPFRDTFPGAPVTPEGYVQQIVDTGDTRLILLDTVDEGHHGGLLCDARLNWLDAALVGAEGRRTIVFMHHPPMSVGFAAMDAIGLANRTEFLALLKHRASTCQIVSGHLHRTVSGAAGGIATCVFKSPCHQSPIMRPGMDEHMSIDEPGAYGILYLGDEGVVVHSEDFGLPGRRALSYV
jgi:Icc protein